MRSLVFSCLVFGAVLIGAQAPAVAGGWQGGDHSIFREQFGEGFTLIRLMRHLGNR